MTDQSYFGLELILKLVENTVQAKSDVLVAFVHWMLIKNSFRSVGIGDDKTPPDGDEQSEMLPGGWNINSSSYALRYVKDGELYILHGTVTQGTIIFNLLQVKTLAVSNVAYELEETIKAMKGCPKTVYANLPTAYKRAQTELLGAFVKPAPKESSSKSSPPSLRQTRASSSLQIGDVHAIPNMGPERGRVGVGAADLDPLGRLGGGMLFNPPRFNPLANRPNPSIIPGARFDPYGPGIGPNQRQYPNPNPDHLMPPDYDDMFM